MQHSYWLEGESLIYIGRLSGSITPTDDIWFNEINLAERLLIYVHSPAYNTMNINSINEPELQSIHILNLGKYKDLLPEVSGIRWINELELATDKVYRLEDY